jgi:regulator of sigma D
MKKYEFQINCGCTCSRCSHALQLEGVEDAEGSHYCRMCDDYVSAMEFNCKERTPEKVAARERKIARTAHLH